MCCVPDHQEWHTLRCSAVSQPCVFLPQFFAKLSRMARLPPLILQANRIGGLSLACLDCGSNSFRRSVTGHRCFGRTLPQRPTVRRGIIEEAVRRTLFTSVLSVLTVAPSCCAAVLFHTLPEIAA